MDPTLAKLRAVTPARIGLGRTGSSLKTSDRLAFQLAHAEAQDAVYTPLRTEAFEGLKVTSQAPDRTTYLARPDLGRRLSETSRALLAAQPKGFDILFVLADGLSAQATQEHAIPMLNEARRRLDGWTFGPVVIAEQARVAIGDEIGDILGASLVVVLIGERPGLTSPKSLGAYITWAPKPGRTDAERNCLSNIRPEGMPYAEAATRLAYLCNEARRRQLTGVALKDESSLALNLVENAAPLLHRVEG